MLVSVVIPSRDGARFLERCLGALLRSELPDGVRLQPIVVDNGSTDGSVELIRSFRGVDAVVVDRPLGFSHANNAARGTAAGDVVCFLNNDAAVHPGWLRRPAEILASDPDVVGVGSKLLFMHRFVACRFELPAEATALVASEIFGGPLDSKVRWSSDAGGEKTVDSRRGRWIRDGSTVYLPVPIEGLDPSSPQAAVTCVDVGARGARPEEVRLRVAGVPLRPGCAGEFVIHDLGSRETVRLVQNAGNFINDRGEGGDVGTGEEDGTGRYEREEIVPALCGAALFVRRSALDAVGWFPTYYSMYYEDVDLCLRLRQRGGTLVFCPSSTVDHYHTGTNREFSPQFIEHVSRSLLLFTFRFGSVLLVLKLLARRFRETRRELLRFRGISWHERWERAHGTRGTVRGLAALGRVVRERLSDALARRPLSGKLLKLSRTRYEPRAETP